MTERTYTVTADSGKWSSAQLLKSGYRMIHEGPASITVPIGDHDFEFYNRSWHVDQVVRDLQFSVTDGLPKEFPFEPANQVVSGMLSGSPQLTILADMRATIDVDMELNTNLDFNDHKSDVFCYWDFKELATFSSTMGQRVISQGAAGIRVTSRSLLVMKKLEKADIVKIPFKLNWATGTFVDLNRQYYTQITATAVLRVPTMSLSVKFATNLTDLKPDDSLAGFELL